MKPHTTAATAALALAGVALPASAGAVFQYVDLGRPNVAIMQDNTAGVDDTQFMFGFDGSVTANLDSGSISGSSNIYASDTTFGGFVSVAEGSSGANGFAQVSIIVDVTVSEDTDVLFEWDKKSATAGFLGGMVIYDIAAGEDLFQPLTGTAGSTVVSMTAGTDYTMIWRMTVDILNPGDHADLFVDITIIPAPSGAACLGLAGLACVRRRR